MTKDQPAKPTGLEFPPRQRLAQRKARLLEYVTIAYQLSAVALLYVVMGSSQAMKTAFFDDILSLVPPIAVLIGNKVAVRPPDRRFAYGYHRAITIAYIAASLALLAFGLFLLIDGLIPLVRGERPTIGGVTLFGRTVWLGWLMLAALVWAAVPPVILGALKLGLAETLHDKVLYGDARMNRAAWMSAMAAALGVFGIGFGFWWADSIAAMAISTDIILDGFKNLKSAVSDAMDEVPRTIRRDRVDPIVEQIEQHIQRKAWVQRAVVRLREEGHVYFGEAYVVPREDTVRLNQLEELTREIADFDWRLHDVAVVPVREVGESNGRPEQA